MAKNVKKEKNESVDDLLLSKNNLKSADEVSEFAENIINTVREPLIVLDQVLRVIKASRSFYDFFKVTSKETTGTLIYDLGDQQWNIPKLRELLETILPEETTFDDYEVEHDFSTIGKRTMLLNARQIQRGSGKERIILLAIEDITERKKIEAGLEKTRKELVAIKKSADDVSEFAENIINTVREPLLALDQNLRVVKASRAFYDFFKVTADETIGTLIYDLGDQQWNIPLLRELLETILPEKTTFDDYVVEHDFSTIGKRIMLLNARQIKRALGKKKIILLAFEDITKRKFAEEALIVSEIRYRRLFESAKDGILILDAVTGKIIDVNPYLNELLGYAREKFIDKEVWEFGFFNDAAASKEKFLELQQKEYVRYEDLPLKTVDGRMIDVEFVSNIYLENGSKIIQCNIRDITERKRAMLIIQKQNIQLQKLNATKDKYFSIIAHDLKSPFQGFIGLTELMGEEISSFSVAQLSAYIQSMNSTARNLYKLLSNLLEWSLMQQGVLSFNPGEIALSEIVAQNIDIIIKRGEQKGIKLILDVEYNQTVWADEAMLNSILRNLLSNAVKFTSSGGEVIVSAKKTEDNIVEIAISDTGMGISHDLLSKLFKIEEKVGQQGTEGEESTGLGLLLCKEFVEKHGGKIWVDSEEGKGSTFYFTLQERN